MKHQNFCSNECSNCLSLKEELKLLESELQNLKSKIAWHEQHPTLSSGIRGETLIFNIGIMRFAPKNASYDLKHKHLKIEVKFSKLGDNGRGILRWTWGKIFGEAGNKKYDRLILIGDRDNRFTDQYKDSNCPYVIFDIPFESAKNFTNPGGNAHSIIRLNSNPNPAKISTQNLKLLYDIYQTTNDELLNKYPE